MKRLCVLLGAIVLMCSCAAPKVAYFQDMQSGNTEKVITPTDIRVQPGDKIMIVVSSKDPTLASIFNLPVSRMTVGSTSGSTSGNQGVSGYTINNDGNIDFPVLGEVHIAGMTRNEISTYIKSELVGRNLIKDPVVTVEFMNLTISVLGEVANPGRFNIDKDHITLLEALSMAGDLTIYGKRDNVTVQREENGKTMIYKVDLGSGADLYASPVYYVKQNDVIYVEPNSVRARQSTVNGNTVRSTSFWLSLASFITSLTVLFVR